MLSSRAQQYLATFERRPSLPLHEVKELFVAGGQPCFDVWLAFHERYAGLVDATDKHRLGLAHPDDGALPARTLRVTCDDWGQECTIQVADTEDRYLLDSRGRLRYERFYAESFEKKLERDALLWEFRQQGKTRYLVDEFLCQNLLRELENDRIFELRTVSSTATEAVDTSSSSKPRRGESTMPTRTFTA